VIPLEAFMAVAEILAYVYEVNQQDLMSFHPGQGAGL
jgi:flagellar biosynthesis protein FlhB